MVRPGANPGISTAAVAFFGSEMPILSNLFGICLSGDITPRPAARSISGIKENIEVPPL